MTKVSVNKIKLNGFKIILNMLYQKREKENVYKYSNLKTVVQ